MRFAQSISISNIDYPGNPANLIFTLGCNLDCPYCHNKKLFDVHQSHWTGEYMLNKLLERVSSFPYLVISGGEPTLYRYKLLSFCEKAKKLGFHIKLDTNGCNPYILELACKNKLIDYVAVDLKLRFDKYNLYNQRENKNSCGVEVRKTISTLVDQDIPHEYRTTIIKSTVNDPDQVHFNNKDAILLGSILNDVYTSKYRERHVSDYYPTWYVNNTRQLADNSLVLYSQSELQEIFKLSPYPVTFR